MNISDKTFKTLEEDLLKATAKLLNKRSRYFYKNEIKIPKKIFGYDVWHTWSWKDHYCAKNL